MKVTFKKRRYYKGKLREIGQVVDMDYKHAKAFIRVNAAVPTVTQAKEEEKEAPKRTKQATPAEQVEVPTATQTVTDTTSLVVAEEEVEELKEVADVGDDASELEELSYRELQERCKEQNLSASGSKEDLIKRLEEGE